MKFGWLLIFLFFLIFCISLHLYGNFNGFSSSPIFVFSVLNIIISFTIMKCEKESAQYFYEIMAFNGLVYDEEDAATIDEQRSNIDSDDDYAESDTSVAIEESADGGGGGDNYDDEKGDGDENLESRIEEFIAETIKRWRKELQLDGEMYYAS